MKNNTFENLYKINIFFFSDERKMLFIIGDIDNISELEDFKYQAFLYDAKRNYICNVMKDDFDLMSNKTHSLIISLCKDAYSRLESLDKNIDDYNLDTMYLEDNIKIYNKDGDRTYEFICTNIPGMYLVIRKKGKKSTLDIEFVYKEDIDKLLKTGTV